MPDISLQQRKQALEIAKMLLFRPYIWGGNDPMDGFDCSGLIVEILQSVGALDAEIDLTADDLARQFKQTKLTRPGCLIFYDWNLDGKMDHVEFVYNVLPDEKILTIAASGGDNTIKTTADAMRKNAYIKMRPARPNHAKICDPF